MTDTESFDAVYKTLMNTKVSSPEWDTLMRKYVQLSLKISIRDNRKKFT